MPGMRCEVVHWPGSAWHGVDIPHHGVQYANECLAVGLDSAVVAERSRGMAKPPQKMSCLGRSLLLCQSLGALLRHQLL